MKFSLKNSMLGAALFAGVVFGVNANAGQTFVNFDPNGDGWEASFTNNIPAHTLGHFSEDYLFQLPGTVAQEGGASVISNILKGLVYNVNFTDFSLWNNSTAPNTLVGGGSTSGNISTFDFGPLGPTHDIFRLHVEGDVVNTLKPSGYAGNISISPVPEPETYAMLLAGLGLIGFSARRRVAAV